MFESFFLSIKSLRLLMVVINCQVQKENEEKILHVLYQYD